LEKLQLSPRTANCLKRAHINKVGEVVDMSDEDLLKIRNFGERSLQELKEKLAELNIPSRVGQGALAPAENGSGAAEDTTEPVADVSLADLGELMGSDDVSSAALQTSTGELEATWPESDQNADDQGDVEEEAE
ncbi:MAG: DNA-directed RNA polymerase subunit alpha C-terminal domain-containing protein, partial [Stenotrophomonas maltophilia]